MSDRNWERELADLDRRLAAVPDAPPTPPTGTPAQNAPAGTPLAPTARGGTPTRATSGTPTPTGRRSWRAQLALLLRLALGVAAVAALVYWPYTSRCGAELGYYLGLVGALGLVGIATSTSAWRHRSSIVHLLGLAMLAGAIILGAREVLPKVGYAVPTVAHPASWSCTP